ncbi:MAG: hypothetical protein ACI8Z1_003350, partial [Candidatus Azotimanducaceae bacterium]
DYCRTRSLLQNYLEYSLYLTNLRLGLIANIGQYLCLFLKTHCPHHPKTFLTILKPACFFVKQCAYRSQERSNTPPSAAPSRGGFILTSALRNSRISYDCPGLKNLFVSRIEWLELYFVYSDSSNVDRFWFWWGWGWKHSF